MNEEHERQADPDPEPIEHSDAERVTGEQADELRKDFDDDPARNPDEKALRDVKGG